VDEQSRSEQIKQQSKSSSNINKKGGRQAIMARDSSSEWATAPGLIDDFDGEITDARWGYRDDYNKKVGYEVPLLILTLEGPELDQPREEVWSAGKGWQIVDGGKSIKHEKDAPGKKRRFIETSLYGRLINRVAIDLGVDMSTRGSPRDAKVWKGLNFHWMIEEQVYGTSGGLMSETGGKGKHLMPTEMASDTPKAGTTKKAAASAPSTDGDSTDKLTTLARSLDKKAFQKAALKMPEVVSNDDLMAEVLGSFWDDNQE
jgi:hypothetical protein